MPNNHALLMSLYENPLAAGPIASDAQVETACHDRIFGYLMGVSDESALELAPVQSLPHVPPRADFAPVQSLPHVPPRADFAPVQSPPHVPPRADFASV